MTDKTREWLSNQIEQHARIQAVEQGYDHTALTRLADAAAALQQRTPGAQAFGLTLPAAGVQGADELVARCLSIIEQRAALLDAATRDQLGKLLQRHGLAQVIASPARPTAAHVLVLWLAVSVEDADSEEELVSREALRRLDGVRADGSRLIDVPCVAEATRGWATDAHARLAFDDATGALRGQLVFDVTSTPSEGQLTALLDCVRTELFDTSWGLNLEWRVPEGTDVFIHLRPQPLSHELLARAPAS
jgi:hypothetical protein